MSEIRYIFIEKKNLGASEWRGIAAAGNCFGLGVALQSPNWADLQCLLVRMWADKDSLVDRLAELALHLDTRNYDYRVFLHSGGGPLSDNTPRETWQEPMFAVIASKLGADRWARLWSVGGSQGLTFSSVVQSIVKDIQTDQSLANSPTPVAALNEAWDQATEFFSIHSKLRSAVLGLYALSDQIEHGTPPGWAPLKEASVRRIAQGALVDTQETLLSLHGESDAKATAIETVLQGIIQKPLDKAEWQTFVAAYDNLKS